MYIQSAPGLIVIQREEENLATSNHPDSSSLSQSARVDLNREGRAPYNSSLFGRRHKKKKASPYFVLLKNPTTFERRGEG